MNKGKRNKAAWKCKDAQTIRKLQQANPAQKAAEKMMAKARTDWRASHPQATDKQVKLNAAIIVALAARIDTYGVASYAKVAEDLGLPAKLKTAILASSPKEAAGLALPLEKLLTLPIYQAICHAAVTRLNNTGKFDSRDVHKDVDESIELDQINWRVVRIMVGEALGKPWFKEAKDEYLPIEDVMPIAPEVADYMPVQLELEPERKH